MRFFIFSFFLWASLAIFADMNVLPNNADALELTPTSLSKTLETIKKNSVIPLSKEQEQRMLKAALSAMLNEYSPKQKVLFSEGALPKSAPLSFEMGRVGLGLDGGKFERDAEVIVTEAIKGSAAEQAGFLAGDIVLAIDKHKVSEMKTFQEVIDKIRGKAGTSVCISRQRKKEIKTICLKRTATPRLRTYFIGDLAVVEVTSLNKTHAEKDFDDALTSIEAKKIKKIIIDFRFNESADLLSGVEFLSALLPNGSEVFATQSLEKKEIYSVQNHRTEKRPFDKIFILQAANAGGMTEDITRQIKKDYPNTLIIGEKSSGHALVKKLFSVENFSILLPWAEIIDSDGKKRHGRPIEPDIEVPAQSINLDMLNIFLQ